MATMESVAVVEIKEANEEINLEDVKFEVDPSTLSSEEIVLVTNIKNFSKRLVHLVDSHFWHGFSLTNYPDIRVNYQGFPKQKGTLPEGVMFGIVYADGTDTTARKFVAAFDSSHQRAYAEAGPIGPVDWNVVKVKLATSGKKTVYDDPILGGRVVAEIEGTNAVATFSG